MLRLFIFVLFTHIMCFNLSPRPNIVIKKPVLKTFFKETRSSYFGYSINLRQNSVLIGAPRAQSTLESQRNVKEIGLVFKCNLNSDGNNQGNCEPFHFDTVGNTRVENDFSYYSNSYESEKKDFQFFGAAMDGHGSETDRFVVCAPKLKADLEQYIDEYYLHGICYFASGTKSSKPSGVQKITPLRAKNLQTVTEKGFSYYSFGESGFSVHVSDNGKAIVIGCPGIASWRGSIILYSTETDYYSGRVEYQSEIPNPYYFDLTDDSYFGFAVSSGAFLGKHDPKIFYVASAPKWNMETGKVFIFDIDNVNEYYVGRAKKIKVNSKLSGKQMGEYFGYSLLTEDFNGDGFPDLLVTAPLYSKNSQNEHGAVYVFINEGNVKNQALKFVDI